MMYGSILLLCRKQRVAVARPYMMYGFGCEADEDFRATSQPIIIAYVPETDEWDSEFRIRRPS